MPIQSSQNEIGWVECAKLIEYCGRSFHSVRQVPTHSNLNENCAIPYKSNNRIIENEWIIWDWFNVPIPRTPLYATQTMTWCKMNAMAREDDFCMLHLHTSILLMGFFTCYSLSTIIVLERIPIERRWKMYYVHIRIKVLLFKLTYKCNPIMW